MGDTIDDLVKSTMAKEHIPGVAVGVIRDGKLVLARGYGTADLEADEPVVPETEFLVASMSKQFCAESILMLAAEGKLSIDDPISKYVDGTPAAWAKVTLRNLLSHQSGIHDIVGVEGFSFLDPTWTPKRILAKLAPLPLDFAPGDRFSYSNSNYYLLGWTVERVSGMTLAEFARKRIFEPAGMTHTRYSRYVDLVPKRARAYLWHEGTQTYTNEWAGRPPAADGSGAVITTLGDWAKYDASLDAGSPVSKAIQAQMSTGVPFNSGGAVEVRFRLVRRRRRGGPPHGRKLGLHDGVHPRPEAARHGGGVPEREGRSRPRHGAGGDGGVPWVPCDGKEELTRGVTPRRGAKRGRCAGSPSRVRSLRAMLRMLDCWARRPAISRKASAWGRSAAATRLGTPSSLAWLTDGSRGIDPR